MQALPILLVVTEEEGCIVIVKSLDAEYSVMLSVIKYPALDRLLTRISI